MGMFYKWRSTVWEMEGQNLIPQHMIPQLENGKPLHTELRLKYKCPLVVLRAAGHYFITILHYNCLKLYRSWQHFNKLHIKCIVTIRKTACPTYDQSVGSFWKGERVPPYETVTAASSSCLTWARENTSRRVTFSGLWGRRQDTLSLVHLWVQKKTTLWDISVNV